MIFFSLLLSILLPKSLPFRRMEKLLAFFGSNPSLMHSLVGNFFKKGHLIGRCFTFIFPGHVSCYASIPSSLSIAFFKHCCKSAVIKSDELFSSTFSPPVDSSPKKDFSPGKCERGCWLSRMTGMIVWGLKNRFYRVRTTVTVLFSLVVISHNFALQTFSTWLPSLLIS